MITRVIWRSAVEGRPGFSWANNCWEECKCLLFTIHDLSSWHQKSIRRDWLALYGLREPIIPYPFDMTIKKEQGSEGLWRAHMQLFGPAHRSIRGKDEQAGTNRLPAHSEVAVAGQNQIDWPHLGWICIDTWRFKRKNPSRKRFLAYLFPNGNAAIQFTISLLN